MSGKLVVMVPHLEVVSVVVAVAVGTVVLLVIADCYAAFAATLIRHIQCVTAFIAPIPAITTTTTTTTTTTYTNQYRCHHHYSPLSLWWY